MTTTTTTTTTTNLIAVPPGKLFCAHVLVSVLDAVLLGRQVGQVLDVLLVEVPRIGPCDGHEGDAGAGGDESVSSSRREWTAESEGGHWRRLTY